MKDISQVNDLMLELLENNTDWQDANAVFTKRGREIIDEICDYAEQTRIFQEHKEKSEIFDGSTAQQVFGYMLDRIVNAPTTIHRNSSVILIMPFVRQKLREEEKAE
jgi:hypothetical protein